MSSTPLSMVLVLAAATSVARAGLPDGGEAHPGLRTNAGSLHAWQKARFGMFIHWGPVTLRGTEIGWSRGPEVPIDEYDSLYREFNPVLFSAREWVGAAKRAGMKYLVITAKHHDGFCLWDSRYADHKITSTPFHRDVLKELADECAAQGIMFCTYYSILDWHHPDYTTRYGGDRRPLEDSDMNIYRTYLKNQVGELVTNYHTKLLWFDGQWEKSWTHQDGMELYAFARGLNDSLLINNRVDKGRDPAEPEARRFAGDFFTPEQKIGAYDTEHPWESCITIGTQWAWKPNDRIKTAGECIRLLVRTAGGGGNLLLNVSPMLDGRIERRQIDRLQAIGAWLGEYGESIYGTSGGPFRPDSSFASTRRGNRIYLHLLAPRPREMRLPLLPGRKITGARLLGGGAVDIHTSGDNLILPVPGEAAGLIDAVIVLDLDGPADTLPPIG